MVYLACSVTVKVFRTLQLPGSGDSGGTGVMLGDAGLSMFKLLLEERERVKDVMP